MRYMIVHKTEDYFDKTNPPPAEFMTKMDAFLSEASRSGVLLAAEGLKHPRFGTKITYKKGEGTPTDGPYAEAKEVIAGFVIVDVRSKEEAIEWANRFGAAFDEVELEVRPITEAADFL